MTSGDFDRDDPFTLLDVTETSTDEEVERAFRRLAKVHHPDLSKEADAASRFSRIKMARDLLLDPAKRAEAVAARAGTRQPRLAEAFEGLFESFGSAERSRGAPFRRRTRGTDVERTVSITLEQAFSGFKGKLAQSPGACGPCQGTGKVSGDPRPCRDCVGMGKYRRTKGFITLDVECPTCEGSGTVTVADCKACAGTGQVQGMGAVFEIPAGARDGMGIILRGMGAVGVGGGSSGDLTLTVRVKPHSVFHRADGDLSMDLAIPVWDAATGCVREFHGIDGKMLQVRVPPGTRGGTEIVLHGQGMPDFPGRGVLRVRVDVVIPKADTPELLEAFESVRRAAGRPTST